MDSLTDMFEDSGRSQVKFSQEETALLLNLLKEYKNIIFCKTTGKVTPKQKERAFEDMLSAFNSNPIISLPRTLDQIKNKINYIKKKSRKETAQYKRDLSATGGGPPPTPLSEPTLLMLETMKESIEGTHSKYDSDRLTNNLPLSQSDSPLEYEKFEYLDESIEDGDNLLDEQNKHDHIAIESSSSKKKKSNGIILNRVQNIQKRKMLRKQVKNIVNISTPQYTRTKFIELAEKKINIVEEKARRQKLRDRKLELEIELLEGRLQNQKLEQEDMKVIRAEFLKGLQLQNEILLGKKNTNVNF